MSVHPRCPAKVRDPLTQRQRRCRNRSRIGEAHCYHHRVVMCLWCKSPAKRTKRWPGIACSTFTCQNPKCGAKQERDD